MPANALAESPAQLPALLAESARLHQHLCPRQVLGVRLGLAAAAALEVAVPQADKRLLAFVETDGCFSDGVMVATGCRVGRRTLRVVDYGKVALTLYDTETSAAVRVAPRPTARTAAIDFAPDAGDRWHAQLLGYQRVPTDTLVAVQRVAMWLDMAALVSRPGVRVTCAECGEEVINEREVMRAGVALCRGCAEGPYYDVCGPG